MHAAVRLADSGDRDLLDRMMQSYLRGFSAVDGRVPDADGRYPYPWLDAYWGDEDRRPYLIDVDAVPAGFALVRLTRPIEMAEFFIDPARRREGVGRCAVERLLALHPGEWQVSQMRGNEGAAAFWRAVIPVPFEESVLPDGRTEQRFRVPAATCHPRR